MNVLDSFKLSGKVAVITGGYGYLGRAFSLALEEAGAYVIVGGRNEEKFKNVFSSIKNIEYHYLDISDTESIRHCFAEVSQKFGSIDILVNNAFYLGGQFPESTTDEELTRSWDGLIGSVYRCIREVIPFMKSQQSGNIINIASMYGLIVPDFRLYEDSCRKFFNSPQYGASKAAIIQLTKYFAEYLIPDNIRVNAIAPGSYPSEFVQQNKEFVKRLAEHNPMRRIGQPEDLKGVLVFLASDASKYMIGQTIQVDGGWTIW